MATKRDRDSGGYPVGIGLGSAVNQWQATVAVAQVAFWRWVWILAVSDQYQADGHNSLLSKMVYALITWIKLDKDKKVHKELVLHMK